jgi:hypothetical protein
MDTQPIDTFYHFIIDRKKRDDLDHLECNERSVVNPDTMGWSNYEDDNLKIRKYINFKINEPDGSVTYEQIYVCLLAWKASVEEFLTEHAIRVCPETTMLVWEELQNSEETTIGSLPIDIMKDIVKMAY